MLFAFLWICNVAQVTDNIMGSKLGFQQLSLFSMRDICFPWCSEPRRRRVCDGSHTQLVCPVGETLSVTFAAFSNTNNAAFCEDLDEPIGACSHEMTEQLQRYCGDGELRTCYVDPALFDDDFCPGTSKRLNIDFECCAFVLLWFLGSHSM